MISWSILTFGLLAISSVLGSGILFRHRRVMTFIGAAAALAEAQWLLLIAIGRLAAPQTSIRFIEFGGALVFCVLFLLFIRAWRFPHQMALESGYRDIVVLILTCVVLLASWLIVSRNGFIGQQLVSHGFYNGDTATLMALVNRSFSTATLVRDNPFAAGTPLEYPTLLHAGIADFFVATRIGLNWLYFLPVMTLAQIFITIPLFFLVFDTVFPEPIQEFVLWFGVRSRVAVHILATAVIGYILSLSWDNYVYPQSHFFLTAFFLVVVALLIRAFNEINWRQLLFMVPILLMGGVLLLSNAIYGTAAVALIGIFCVCRILDSKRSLSERIAYLVLAGIVVTLFLRWSPGNGSFGRIKFSYTAAADMIALAPALALLVAGLLQRITKHRFLVASAAGLFGLAFVSFFFSKRNIVIDNSSRFFYMALLVSFPLMISILIQLYYWLKRALVDTSHTFIEHASGWAILLTAVLLSLFPGLASVASAQDHLMRQDEHIISPGIRQAMLWIELTTSPQAVFIESPNEPFTIPLITGRSVLRTDYWLSPDDSVLADIKAAFTGDKAAQEQILSQADYLFLTPADQAVWGPLPLPKIFDTSEAVIYRLK